MRGRPSPSARDAGETLIELIVAVVIMGIAVAAVVGGIATSITMSDIHRKQATAGASVRDYAETIETYISGGGYVSCATSTAYTPAKVGYTAPSGYTAAITALAYWQDSTTTPTQATPAFYSTCPSKTNGATGDSGLQQLSLKVSSADGRATEKLIVVLRQPCADLSCH